MRTVPRFDPSDLSIYLAGPGEVPSIGPERGRHGGRVRRPRNGVATFVSPHGSVRYVQYLDGHPIAALQVVTRGLDAKVANVFVVTERRRQGWATSLFRYARRDFHAIEHADDWSLSIAGKLWRDATRTS